MRKLTTLLFGCVYIFASQAQCISNSANVFSFYFQYSNYEIVKENKTWADARNCAISRGGNLAIIDSQAEQDTLFHYLNLAGIATSSTVAPDGGGASYIWLSGNDRAIEGNWVWDKTNASNVQFWQGQRNGSPVGGAYNNWGNEPDDFQGQDALGLALTNWPFGVAGQWNDLDELNSLYYVIEIPLTIGLEEEKKTEVTIYPNPCKGHLYLQREGNKELSIEVYSIEGQLVKKVQNITDNIISTTDLIEGAYILKMEDGKQIMFTKQP